MGKRKVLNESALKEIRLPEEGENVLLGRVIKLLGSDQVLVKCTDGITRRGRIRGKLKRRGTPSMVLIPCSEPTPISTAVDTVSFPTMLIIEDCRKRFLASAMWIIFSP